MHQNHCLTLAATAQLRMLYDIDRLYVEVVIANGIVLVCLVRLHPDKEVVVALGTHFTHPAGQPHAARHHGEGVGCAGVLVGPQLGHLSRLQGPGRLRGQVGGQGTFKPGATLGKHLYMVARVGFMRNVWKYKRVVDRSV